jgi:hypothetical protein
MLLAIILPISKFALGITSKTKLHLSLLKMQKNPNYGTQCKLILIYFVDLMNNFIPYTRQKNKSFSACGIGDKKD